MDPGSGASARVASSRLNQKVAVITGDSRRLRALPPGKAMIMAKVILGNHTAVFAVGSDQDRIRKFYGDVLGCIVRVKTDEVDRYQLDDVHFCFVWQSTALNESDFLKAIYLELKTDNSEEMKQKILAFGVKTLDLPDPHLYFQAPGGQVFKLVGIDEDLSKYEASPSSRPGASASAS
jgi:hypothetical protein